MDEDEIYHRIAMQGIYGEMMVQTLPVLGFGSYSEDDGWKFLLVGAVVVWSCYRLPMPLLSFEAVVVCQRCCHLWDLYYS